MIAPSAEVTEAILKQVQEWTCDDQHSIAQRIASNIGYKLVPEDGLQEAEDKEDALSRLKRLEAAMCKLNPSLSWCGPDPSNEGRMKMKKALSKVDALLIKMQKREDDVRAERRRKLANGMSRALLHLSDAEMDEIEPVLHGAIGRSIMAR